ncbi:MAG TPA: GAF domain-containing protein [Candidatus Methylomirabilis sp.]|nr:GAF domain-containing protein [Candidatus Methylomirabilis sp.]
MKQLPNRVIAWVLGVSVRVKIMGIVLGLVLLLGVGVIIQVLRVSRATLSRELDERAVSIARDVAARAADLILIEDFVSLRDLVLDSLTTNKDVRYIFVLDGRGNVLAHTFGHFLPPDLQVANSGTEYAGGFRIQRLASEEGILHDVAVPIFEGRAGVIRVGMLEERLERILSGTTKRLLLLIAAVSLFGVVAAYLPTIILTKPLLELKNVAEGVGRGDFRTRARVRFGDEIGQLTATFNAMVDSLEAFRREVMRRNEELATLNIIAATVSQSLELQKVLEDALDKVLEIMRLSHGEILLFDAESGSIVPRVYRGISSQLALEIQAFSVGEGIPGLVAQLEQPVLIEDDLAADPRLLRRSLVARESLRSMVSVPLRSKDRVVGVLDLFSSNVLSLTPEQLRLLVAIGDQIGVAVENARLLEELKTKEQMRLQLLEKVITAQEDERKRVARELHDETGQSLTSLIVGLKVLESMANLPEITEKAAELRALGGAILRDVHELAFQLRPTLLDHLGMVAAIQRLVEDYSQKVGFHIDLQVFGFDGRRLPPATETALYRLVQEALTNVTKHAQAKNVSVILRRGEASVLAIVEDDGKGFNVAEVMGYAAKEKKLGLYGMEERAALVGGKLTIESTPGKGTTVFVDVPLEQ